MAETFRHFFVMITFLEPSFSHFVSYPFQNPQNFFYFFDCIKMETKIEPRTLSTAKDIEIQKITPTGCMLLFEVITYSHTKGTLLNIITGLA